MATIRTAIELQDNFSNVLNEVTNSVNLSVSAMEDLSRTMNAPVDASAIDGARDAANQAAAAIQEMNTAMEDLSRTMNTPVEWQSDSLEVFTATGVERFEQEVQSANNMLRTLNQTQSRIAETAAQTDLFPANAAADMNNMQSRLQAIQNRMQQIESNPLNMGTDAAISGLEQLRARLDQAVQQQQAMNDAVDNMDVEAANAAYLQLSQTVSNTERYIRDNVDEQGQFNNAVREGSEASSSLINTVKRLGAAYLTVQSVKAVAGVSDEIASANARLSLMIENFKESGTAAELFDKVYASAQDARGSFGDMAAVVARFGNNARDAFSSTDEVVQFAGIIQKQMTIAGASTAEASNAMLQLSQALGSGVLRGDELNSIFEQAPNLIQSIADYMGVPIGKIRGMASEGQLTADIVKNAIFASSDAVNAKFEQMPMTWSQACQMMQNSALKAFQGVLELINKVANSSAFQSFAQGVTTVLSAAAFAAEKIFGVVSALGGAIANIWNGISPLVYGAAAALGVYCIALLAATAATKAQDLATRALAAAQRIANSAMLANPVFLVTAAIAAMIAAIYAACTAVAHLAGDVNTGFGVMTGGINVVIQGFKNLGIEVANVAIGIGNALAAAAANMLIAFSNAINKVKGWFYSLLSDVLTVIWGICGALNELPFIDFDYSGLYDAANNYAQKSAAASGDTTGYVSVADAFNEGINTFDAFQNGWAEDAFNSGADWGDGVANKIKQKLSGVTALSSGGISTDSIAGSIADSINGGSVADSLSDIADNTSDIADNTDEVDFNQDIAELIRDYHSTQATKGNTTQYITIDLSGQVNHISNSMELTEVTREMVNGLKAALNTAPQGV